VERPFAWLGHFRRLIVRDERLITVCAGFFHLAGALLTLRMVLK
jgi:transposase